MFVVKPVGTNAVFLQWVSTSGSVANFTVMYQPITTPPMVTLATVACQTCNYTIGGLTQRWVYSFAIGYGGQVSLPLTAAVGAGRVATTTYMYFLVERLLGACVCVCVCVCVCGWVCVYVGVCFVLMLSGNARMHMI